MNTTVPPADITPDELPDWQIRESGRITGADLDLAQRISALAEEMGTELVPNS